MSLQDMFKESHYWDNGWTRSYCGILGHSFILRLCRRWNEGSLHNSLTFSEEARGSGGLSVTSLLQILDQCNLTDYDICFVQIGEMMSRQLKNDSLGLNIHELMHALINIVEEFHRQGVRRVVFAPLFPGHHSGYNKRCNRLNKLMSYMPDVNIVSHSDHMTRTLYDIDKIV